MIPTNQEPECVLGQLPVGRPNGATTQLHGLVQRGGLALGDMYAVGLEQPREARPFGHRPVPAAVRPGAG